MPSNGQVPAKKDLVILGISVLVYLVAPAHCGNTDNTIITQDLEFRSQFSDHLGQEETQFNTIEEDCCNLCVTVVIRVLTQMFFLKMIGCSALQDYVLT